MHFVYKTEHVPSGRYYIGVHSGDIDDVYLGSGKLLNLLINKHGREAFKREVIATCETRDDALQLEAMIVQQFLLDKKLFPLVLNLVRGGKTTVIDWRDNDLTRARKSEANRRKWSTPEFRAKFSETRAKTLAKPEYRAMMSAIMSVSQSDPEVNKRRGESISKTKMSPEWTEKKKVASEKLKASLALPEVKAKKSAFKKEWWAKRKANGGV